MKLAILRRLRSMVIVFAYSCQKSHREHLSACAFGRLGGECDEFGAYAPDIDRMALVSPSLCTIIAQTDGYRNR